MASPPETVGFLGNLRLLEAERFLFGERTDAIVASLQF
jgi:hypothetical protein